MCQGPIFSRASNVGFLEANYDVQGTTSLCTYFKYASHPNIKVLIKYTIYSKRAIY